jgi:hypothetical protein
VASPAAEEMPAPPITGAGAGVVDMTIRHEHLVVLNYPKYDIQAVRSSDSKLRCPDPNEDYYLGILKHNLRKMGFGERIRIVKSSSHILIQDNKTFVLKLDRTPCNARNLMLEFHDVDYDYDAWKKKMDEGGFNIEYSSRTTPLKK